MTSLENKKKDFSIVGDCSISITPRARSKYKKPKNGKKKHRYETDSFSDKNKDGEYVSIARVYDRENDRYVEVVKKEDSGEILHHVDEQLSSHIGHGSDKNQKK